MALGILNDSGKLYIVGTPIGNLEDMTMRAIKTLQTVDLIASEDTRHTGKLLHHFQIQTPQISYHAHNSHARDSELLHYIQAGKNIALVSDAGMPSISDPGFELVQACIDAKITVVPIPGVSACTTALVASGLATDCFTFVGFLATVARPRQFQLEQIAIMTRTIIIYEAPHRLLRTLKDLAQHLEPERKIVLGRELTKLHEEFWRGNLTEAIAHYAQHAPRGEFSLVVAGLPENVAPTWTEAQLKSELEAIIAAGESRSEASRQLAEITKLSRRQLYQMALTIEIN